MPSYTDLLQPGYYAPVARCAGLGLLIFIAAWWRNPRSGGLSFLLLALGWVLCHLMVNANSYLFPPKESADWLVFGSLALLPAAAFVWLGKRGEGHAAVLAGILLGVVAWLALHKLPWLIDHTETPFDRWLWTSGIITAVLAAYGAAAASAPKIPAVPFAALLAVFAALTGTALFTLAMPERITARLLALAALAAGLTLALFVHHFRRRPVPTLPSGLAGWFAGGLLLLFILGCLSRASGVPILPMGIAAAAFPAAALLLFTCGHFLGRGAFIFALVLLIAGGAVTFTASRDHLRPPDSPAAAAAPTGADDTGAYDGL